MVFWVSMIIFFIFCGYQNIFLEVVFDNDKKISFYYILFITSLIGFIGSLCLFFMILVIKVKTSEKWKITKISINFLKYFLSNDFTTMIGRMIFTLLIIHKVISVFFIFILETNYVYFDTYSIYNVYGLPLIIINLIITFVTTICIQLPMRIFLKNVLSLN